MYCTNCGKEVDPDAEFCTECGEVLKKEGVSEPAPAAEAPPPRQVAPPPAPAQTPPPQPPGPPPQAAVPVLPPAPQVTPVPPGAGPVKAKTRKKWLIPVLAGAAVAVLVAVVLVLVLVVFKAPGPEATVNDLYAAIERNDASAVVALVDPSQLKEESGLEKEFKDYIEANIVPGIKFEGLGFDTKTSGDKATVKIVKGKATFKDQNGKTVTEDASKMSGESSLVLLVKKDGKWYVDTKTFPDFYATVYLKDADAALVKLGNDVDAQVSNIQSSIEQGAAGVATVQELNVRFKQQTADVDKTLNDLRKQADETKAKYESVNSLEDVAQYKEYAALRIKSVDALLSAIDLLGRYLDEIGGYISGLAANPPTTQGAANAAVQGAQNIVDSYTAQINALLTQAKDFEDQANQLQEDLGL